MNIRNTIILFVVATALILIFTLVMIFGPKGDAEDYALRSLREEISDASQIDKFRKEVTKVEIERGSPPGETIIFERQGESGWRMSAPYEARIEAGAIDRIISEIVAARADKSADVHGNALEQFGLDRPSATVTLRKGDKGYRLHFGAVTLNKLVFVADGANPKEPIAVNKRTIESLFRTGAEDAKTAGEMLKSITDFRPRNLLADGVLNAADEAKRVHLKEGDRKLTLKRGDDSIWRFADPANFGEAESEGDAGFTEGPKPITGVKQIVTALTGLRMPDDKDIEEGLKQETFEKYGLIPGKESLRIELELKGGTESLLVGGKADDKGDKLWVRVGEERFAAKLEAKALESLRKVAENPSVIRDRTLLRLNVAGIDAIDVKPAGESPFALRRFGTPALWRVGEPGAATMEAASGNEIRTLIDALIQRRSVKDFPDPARTDADLGFDKPTAEITIWVDGIAAPAKKDDDKKEEPKKEPAPTKPTLKGDPAVRLVFGKKDKDIVYVKRIIKGEGIRFAVPEVMLGVVARGEGKYLDTALPSFVKSQAVKVSFNRGSVKYMLDKEKKDDPASLVWKLIEPAEMKSRTLDMLKVDQLIGSLSGLSAIEVFAKKGTDQDLQRWGLKPPKVEASVEIKDAKEPIVFQFGESADKENQRIYLKVAGKDRVYVVFRSAIDMLLSGELIDLTVTKIDMKKVNKFKFTGWKDVVGSPTSWEYDRVAAANWTAVGKKDVVADGARLESFLLAISNLRTDRFVMHQGGPKPEHKLDTNAGALAIEITVEGEKEPVILTIGAGEGTSFFAQSNGMPGTVFTLPQAIFETGADKLRLKPAYFNK
jgi:hypothetical protein